VQGHVASVPAALRIHLGHREVSELCLLGCVAPLQHVLAQAAACHVTTCYVPQVSCSSIAQTQQWCCLAQPRFAQAPVAHSA
jgi:hypothetical protein